MLRFPHYYLKTKLSFYTCFGYVSKENRKVTRNTFVFPSIRYSQFKRINLPNARPRSHYSEPPGAPRCLLKPEHLSLTLSPDTNRPRLTLTPLPATRNDFCSKRGSCFCLDWTHPSGSIFLKRSLTLHSESPPKPSPLYWGPSSHVPAMGPGQLRTKRLPPPP